MGPSSSIPPKHPQPLTETDLQFYTDLSDPQLGSVKIYTSKKFRLCFILKYERPQGDSKIYNIFKKVEENQLTPLLSLHGFRIERQTCLTHICEEKVTSYWEYYNFYFNEYLARRSHQGLSFSQQQIWHIIEICCETYNLFRKFGIYYEINPQTLVITPEGKLKALWCHLRSHNYHLKYFQYFDSNCKINKFPYAPEELKCFHKKQRTTKIDFDKCNAYRLGILLLHCLTLADPLALCYSPSITSINHSAIRGLLHRKVLPNYSPHLAKLLTKLLREDAGRRPTLEQVYLESSGKFSPYFELKVYGIRANESNQSKNQEAASFDMQRKGSDFSDAKTVKYNHSPRKN